ncbi:MAG: competence protein ComEC, partial [Solirubrobacteraceae bacterium]|nr:competence protein ComEC [Solirubrobacteraceae bacterium]
LAAGHGPVLAAVVVAGVAAAVRGAARRPALLAGLLAAAALAGALVAQARTAQLDRSRLAALSGASIEEPAFLLDIPRETQFGGWRATVLLRGERVALTAGRWVPRPDVAIGAQLRVAGTVKGLSAAQQWMRSRNVHAALSARRVVATGAARGGASGFVDRIRRRAEHALEAGVPPAVAGLLRGMVLGEGEALDSELQDDFRAASLTHLVAASGQNVALLAALAVALGTALGLGLRGRLGLALALVVLYVPLAGAGPSIQRAGVMGCAALVAALDGRPGSRVYALLLAAALTLLANPRSASDPGWQLSFAAVIGIAVGAGRAAEALRRRGVHAGAAEAAGMTVAATVSTAPLIALHFGRASLVALPANLLAAPAVAPAMWLGAIAAALGQASVAAASPFAALAALPAAYLAWLGHCAAHVPGANVRLPLGVVVAVCALAAASLLRGRVGRRRRSRPVGRALALCASVAAIVAAGAALAGRGGEQPPTGARISFLDIGQGDATLIQDGGRAVLVDTGPLGDRIADRVHREGARRLDLLVITHAQADHQGGAAEVLSGMPVGAVLDGRDGVISPEGARLEAAARARGVRLLRPAAGQVLRVGPIRLDVLSPPAQGRVRGADPNARAIVLEAVAAGVRLLLTADAESDVLAPLQLAPVDVLKVSHHGSADPGLPGLLAVLRPRAAVIEVGRHNPYGHPAPATVRALAAGAGRVLRTDRDGTVRLDVRGGRLVVTTHG